MSSSSASSSRAVDIPDVNVLLYASDSSSRQHDTARTWLEGTLSGSETVGFASVALLGFIRIATSPRVMTRPLTPSEAFDQVEEWLDQPPATIVGPGGNLTTDAHLAALAIEHGAGLASFDGDFHRFAGLRLDYVR